MHPLKKLMLRNQHRGFFHAAKLKVPEDASEATIYLYDMIVADDMEAEWYGGISPLSFVKTLAEMDVELIHLRINSPGGDVFAGRVMEQAIKNVDAKVVAHIDGLAASAATYVALAADEVVMSEGSLFMIHQAWSMAWGNSEDMLQVAGLLEKIDGTLVKTYAKVTGRSEDEILEWMKAETWFTAEEAISIGFADRIAEEKIKNQIEWDLSAYMKTPSTNSIIKHDDPELAHMAALHQESLNRFALALAA